MPFAYTDSFIVNTVYEGIQYKYSCFIDETQMGAISLLEKTSTSKENGTEIIIPVKNKFDKQRFQDAIFKQLSYFRNIKYINFEAPENTVLYEDEYCVVIERAPYRDLHLVLGSVAYPIDTTVAGIDRWQDNTGNCYLGLKFKIGELQPTISRESIFWNESVKKKVHAKIALARKSIRTQIELELSKEKDYAKWYASVSQQKSKSFPNQWAFSRITTSAIYTPTDGSKPLKIKSIQADWFGGMYLRTVTPYNGYSKRRKANSTKNPEYSTSGASLNDLIDLPTFQIEGPLSARKTLFLFKTNPKGFVVVADTGIDSLDRPQQDAAKPYYKQALKWRDGLKKFDEVVVPDDEFVSTSDDDYKEAYKKIVALRKLEGKFTAKKLGMVTTYSSRIEDNFTWQKFESKFEDHKNDLIIYGTQEEHTQLVKITAMLTFTAGYMDKYDGLANVTVLKVAQNYLKQFGQMPNAHNIIDIFKMTTPLNTQLSNIVTAHRYEESIKQYEVLRNFDDVNKEVRNKFLVLHAFIVKNTQNKRWHEIGLLKEIIDLCTTSGVTNKTMDTHFEEIEKYVDGADLLKFVTYNPQAVPSIRDYLTIKGKSIDPYDFSLEKEGKEKNSKKTQKEVVAF